MINNCGLKHFYIYKFEIFIMLIRVINVNDCFVLCSASWSTAKLFVGYRRSILVTPLRI